MFSNDWHLVTGEEEMAKEFNNYFSNVFTVEDADNIPDPVIVHAGKYTLIIIGSAEPEVEAKLKEMSLTSRQALAASCPKSQCCIGKCRPAPLPDLQQNLTGVLGY